MGTITIPNLEFHVTHACNLHCDNCSHLSNYGLSGHISLESADRSMGNWSSRITPRLFSLLGGEPTLHPQLAQMVDLASSHWHRSQIQLVTNGWFLSRHPALPAALEKHGATLEISVHHTGEAYMEKVSQIRSLIKEWSSSYSFTVHWRPSFDSWRRIYNGHGAEMLPYADNNPEQSWKNCPARACPQIYEGSLYKCPPLTYLPLLDKKFGLKKEWSPYLSYRPLHPSCSTRELRKFLEKGPESVCSMCPAQPPRLQLSSPLAPVRMAST